MLLLVLGGGAAGLRAVAFPVAARRSASGRIGPSSGKS